MKPNNSKERTGQERKVSLPTHRSTQSRICIEELRENYKRQNSLPNEQEFLPIYDPLEKAMRSKNFKRKKTGVIYDEKMSEHKCLWDPDFPECPERLISVIKRCKEYNLLEKCDILESEPARVSEILTLHDESLHNILKETEGETVVEKLKNLSSTYDSIYIHPKSYECALLSAGCTLKLVRAILQRKIHNGMALVRPPGHHATREAFCGYSFFNNVALAANEAIDVFGVKRVLIVDWDVHHGQATQRMFYDDPRVLYFSFHRYENGSYWPHLRESDFDFIGADLGSGYNVNIPLNTTGLKNEDFLAVFHQILLPIAYQFNPELVLISSGYDAAESCPEGEMKLSPSVYAHFISLLSSLSEGRLAVILEGGYCIDSLAEGAALTLRSLLGYPCPVLIDPLAEPHPSIQKIMQSCVSVHRSQWKCLQALDPLGAVGSPSTLGPSNEAIVKVEYMTTGGYPTTDDPDSVAKELGRLKAGTCLTYAVHHLCVVYDSQMEEHINEADPDFPERPQRTRSIMKQLEVFGILNRALILKSREVLPSELELVHERSLINMVSNLPGLSPKDRKKAAREYNSIYFNAKTAKAANLAAGSLLQIVDSVCEGQSRCGIGVVRPPGHHAEEDEPYGFCIFNNVAVAASYAMKKHRVKRILIIDWDIHHGNGIQRIFESDPNVLYISIHLYKNGDFFPFSIDGAMDRVGLNEGKGYNVNIPWSKGGVGDAEYIAAFNLLVLPIAYQFNPELILISAGFDAAIHDPLGGCRVTPECFGHLTSLLSSLAGGRLILGLEGGYNLNSTSLSMVMCAKALLGDPLPSLKDNLIPSKAALIVIEEVREIQMEFWSCLCPLTISPVIVEKAESTKLEVDEPEPKFLTPPESPFHDAEEDLLASGFAAMSLKEPKHEQSELANKDEEPILEGAVGGTSNEESSAFFLSCLADEGMFAVVPLNWCPHLTEVNPVPKEGIDTSAKCQSCLDPSENWICLSCYEVFCGRYVREHMVLHSSSSGHKIVLSFSDLSVWCYDCESYLHNKILEEALNSATLSKFGNPS